MSRCQNELRQVFLMLKNIDRRVTYAFEKRTDISLTRYEILYALEENGQMTQTALQQKLAIDQAAITRHVKILEDQELITRERNIRNNREILVAISPKGTELLNGCNTGKNQCMADLYEGFTPEEIDQLADLISRLNKNAEAL